MAVKNEIPLLSSHLEHVSNSWTRYNYILVIEGEVQLALTLNHNTENSNSWHSWNMMKQRETAETLKGSQREKNKRKETKQRKVLTFRLYPLLMSPLIFLVAVAVPPASSLRFR